jgi:hypothetical protein
MLAAARQTDIFQSFMARLKSCPDTKHELFRSLPGRRRRGCSSPTTGLRLELRFEGELVETRGVVRIEVTNDSEVGTAKFSTAVPQREDEVGSVADVVGLGSELEVHALGQREVLEE